MNVHPLSALDGALAERFVRATDHPTRHDWDAVEHRAQQLLGRRRRRLHPYVLAAALILAAIALATPALGLDRIVVDFFRAEHAPEVVRVDIRHWFDEVSPTPEKPGVSADESRKVYSFVAESGRYDLFVSPARGGYCWLIRRVAGSCEDSSSAVISPLWSDVPRSGDPVSDPAMVAGAINAASAARLALTFEDGTSTDLPFVFVSDPIDAGFFYYELPRNHLEQGSRPRTLTVYGEHDRVLAGVGADESLVLDPLDSCVGHVDSAPAQADAGCASSIRKVQ